MDRLTAIAALLGAAAFWPAVAGAELSVGQSGVSLVPPAANTGAVAPSEQASTAREPKKTAGQTLRCWQHGRLLFESPGFKADAEKQPNAVTIQRIDGDAVVVYDQKDSVCILSKK